MTANVPIRNQGELCISYLFMNVLMHALAWVGPDRASTCIKSLTIRIHYLFALLYIDIYTAFWDDYCNPFFKQWDPA